MLFIVFLITLLLSSCGHPKAARVQVPPPPPAEAENAPAPEKPAANLPRERPAPEGDLAEPTISADARPIDTEFGKASWYGPPYHNRRGSNGEIYNMNAMTAAHLTLPLGSIVRVTSGASGS